MSAWAFFALGVLAHMLLARVLANNDRRDTPLHIACRKGNVKNVKNLLDRGADPNVFNFFRETPLLLACASDNPLIVKMLLDRAADSNDSRPETRHPLALPVSGGEL
jgi:ankyrin repeat protein